MKTRITLSLTILISLHLYVANISASSILDPDSINTEFTKMARSIGFVNSRQCEVITTCELSNDGQFVAHIYTNNQHKLQLTYSQVTYQFKNNGKVMYQVKTPGYRVNVGENRNDIFSAHIPQEVVSRTTDIRIVLGEVSHETLMQKGWAMDRSLVLELIEEVKSRDLNYIADY